MLAIALLLPSLAAADAGISAAGVTVKVKGQSGKMTITIPDGNANSNIECQMVALRQIDAEGNLLGGGGSEKHSFNSFATQSFTFHEPKEDTYQGLDVATITFESVLVGSSKVRIDTMIFKEEGSLEVGDDILNVSAGAVKFNVELGNWSWCGEDAACKGNEGVGESVELDIAIYQQSEKAGNETDSTGEASAGGSSNGNGNNSNNGNSGNGRRLMKPVDSTMDINLGSVSLTMLSTYSNDGGKTWMVMPEGYPKMDGDRFTLRFPKWNGTVIYDPIVQSSVLSFLPVDDSSSDGETSGSTTTYETTSGSTNLVSTTEGSTEPVAKIITIIGQAMLTVADAPTFVEDEHAKTGIQKAIALKAGTAETAVSVNLSVAMASESRRLEASKVQVDFAITEMASSEDATSEGSALVSTLQNLNSTELAEAIIAEIVTAGGDAYAIEVAAFNVDPAAITDAPQQTATTTGEEQTTTPAGDEESYATSIRLSSTILLLAILATAIAESACSW